ncbi:asparagine synthase (glutamine-hydrolyzing) [Rummeliibacillus pycnus]|uniref:asparagine synthase (glutamine-hydrolyzing) n=1 Tax=Rummeliibacillus pycnus TaxID=101070 RepID=UPI0037C7F998
MCGITGWCDFKKDLSSQLSLLHTMTKTLQQRGPDAEGIWCNGPIGFGHQRLAIIDLEGGKQPMSYEKKGRYYTITYNGELYNTDELRKELQQRGYHFYTTSDTEVLLVSYIEWREQCVEKLNGIFAFGIWDSAEKSLLLVRDRLGVKPLYYSTQNNQLLFASEIKAILAHPDVSATVGHEGLAELFGLGPSHTPGKTIYKHIQELRPGHLLKYDLNGLKISRYWNVKSKTHEDSFDDTVTNVRDLVVDAVERQLVSDVPVCTLLSGGLDSSIITAIAANKFANTDHFPLHTYSINYENNAQFFKANDFQRSDDTFWINEMSQTFHTVHHSEVILQETLIKELRESVYAKDMPGMADIDSSLLWFSKQIKDKFKVSLSGECADEIFGGYPWFYANEADGFPWIRSTKERINLLRTEWQQKINIEDYVREAYEVSSKETPMLDGESLEDAKRRELFYLNITWFMTTLLDRKDRTTMRTGLEVRVPFADHRLVEYVWNIPWEIKNTGNMEKGILRKAMEDLLPKEVLYRKKNPYPKTHNPAYTDGVGKWLSSILQNKNSVLLEFFNKEQLDSLIDSGGSSFTAPWFGQLMTGPQLLAYLIQTHIWFEDYNINLTN